MDGIVGKCKTETSRRPVLIDEFTIAELQAWKRETSYAAPDDWVFASERVQGKMPPWADTLLDRFLQPAARRAGGKSHGQIVDAISISERPAEVEGRAIPGH